MRPTRAIAVTLPALLVLSLEANEARAQGWMGLPNGNLGYVTDYTTSGFFSCNIHPVNGSCYAQSNFVVFTHGSSSMTLTFHGVTQHITTTTHANLPIPVGTIEKTVTGGPFTFPGSRTGRYLFMGISLSSSNPAATGGWHGSFLFRNNTLKPIGFGQYFYLPTTPHRRR